MPPSKQHDPEEVAALRDRFVMGDPDETDGHTWPTLAVLAQDFSGTKSMLERISAAERWAIERDRYRLELARTQQQVIAAEHGVEAARFDRAVYESAQMGVAMVAARLTASLETGEQLGVNTLRTLAETLERFQMAGRKALGVVEGVAVQVHHTEDDRGEVIDVGKTLDEEMLSGGRLDDVLEVLDVVGARRAIDRGADGAASEADPTVAADG